MALGLEAAMNSSCFQPYCSDGDAGKMAHVQATEAKPRSRDTLSFVIIQHILRAH